MKGIVAAARAAVLLARGIAARPGVAVAVFVVAVLAVAVAVTGVIYARASAFSVVRDTVAQAPATGQGLLVGESGQLKGTTLAALRADERRFLGPGAGDRLLSAAVRGFEYDPTIRAVGDYPLVVWREDACAHLPVVAGRCPAAADEVIVSQADVTGRGWRLGRPLRLPGFGKIRGTGPGLRVVGVYAVKSPTARYWAAQPYFPSATVEAGTPSAPDAVFTPRATFTQIAPRPLYGTVRADRLVPVDSLRPDDVQALWRSVDTARTRINARHPDATVLTTLDQTAEATASAREQLVAPMAVITVQVLALGWLLLATVVGDSVHVRSDEVALAKLRGRRRLAVLAVAVGEPVSIAVLAIPVGLAAAWLATTVLTDRFLRAGVPVQVPPLAWAVAAAAVTVGLGVAAVAARRALAQPVAEHWRRTLVQPQPRGWTGDAILLTLASAAVVVAVAGPAGGNLALAAPGLLIIAAAVVAARLRAPVGRAFIMRSRSRGGLALFLASRQLARRPDSSRVVVLAVAAVGFVCFAAASWSSTETNAGQIAATAVGAPTVTTLTSTRPDPNTGTQVPTDPGSGRVRVVSSTTIDGEKTRTLLAADPARFAQVAYWRHDFTRDPVDALARRLHPPAPAPLHLRGDGIRMRVTTADTLLADGPLTLILDVDPPGGQSVPLALGRIRQGQPVRLEAPLPRACRTQVCRVAGLHLERPAGTFFKVGGALRLSQLQTHDRRGWRTMAQAFTTPGRWQPAHPRNNTVQVDRNQLLYAFTTGSNVDPEIDAVDIPVPLPAIVTSAVARHAGQPLNVIGLDGQPLRIKPIAVASRLPSAGSDGILVDRAYALRAAGGTVPLEATQQVWTTRPDQEPTNRASSGLLVVDVEHARTVEARLLRTGPALALGLLLAETTGALVLTLIGISTHLLLTRGRRRHELSALAAAGASRTILGRSIWLEHTFMLLLGVVFGATAGLAAGRLSIPQVATLAPPAGAPPLLYQPNAAAIIAAAVLTTLAAALTILTSARLVARTINPASHGQSP